MPETTPEKIVSIPDLAAHVAFLATSNSVEIIQDAEAPIEAAMCSDNAYAILMPRNLYESLVEAGLPRLRAIFIRTVDSHKAYAAALHELGHLCAPGGITHDIHQYLTREEIAWDWARAHALIWTPEMDAFAAFAYGTHVKGYDRVIEHCKTCKYCAEDLRKSEEAQRAKEAA